MHLSRTLLGSISRVRHEDDYSVTKVTAEDDSTPGLSCVRNADVEHTSVKYTTTERRTGGVAAHSTTAVLIIVGIAAQFTTTAQITVGVAVVDNYCFTTYYH